MDLQALLMEKWPYKIAAIVLSVLVWLNVTAERETEDQSISTRLEFVVQDSAWAIGEAPSEVSTIFQGRSGDIIALFNEPVIRVVLESVEDSIVEVVLDVDDVEYDRSLSVIATSVTPSRVFVHLEPRVVRKVPVLAMTDATPAAGFAIDRLTVQPDSIRLSGPASVVEPVTAVATDRVELGQIRESVTRLVGIQLPEGAPSLRGDPTQVSLTVEVDSMIVRRFQVTVGVEGDGAGTVTIDPAVVRVDVSGAAETVATLSPTDLDATVRIDGPLTEPTLSQVQISLPSGINARAVSDPASVTVSPASDDGGPSPGVGPGSA